MLVVLDQYGLKSFWVVAESKSKVGIQEFLGGRYLYLHLREVRRSRALMKQSADDMLVGLLQVR